jgi:shikimate kinase
MKLIFIYGPPASGKLTVAEKLSEATGIPLFHNHLSRDIVKDIYGDELMQHYDLVRKIRFDILEYCANNNADLIFTYVYAGSDDDNNVRDFTNIIKTNRGKVLFVELTANVEDLMDRVDNDSRKRFKKLTDKEIMAKLSENMSKFSIPYVESLKINTSDLSSEEAASLIVNELHLV